MKSVHLTLAALAALAASAVPGFSAPADSGAVSYHVSQTFHIGGPGGWDYLTVDPADQLLFVPRSTHTMVLKESDGSVVADIPGQKRNHGVALVPQAGRGFISDGADGSVVVFDLNTYKVVGKIKAREDADGIIYDKGTNKVLLVCGDAGVLIPISPDIDLRTGSADPAIELGGKPEFLQADGRGKVFVNLVNKAQVAVVDIKAGKVLAHWSTAPGGTPVGMAIDRAHHRLYIGCRRPQKLIVMDSDNGKVLADLPLGAGNDAVKFDGGYALASCGDGTLTVAGEASPGHFAVIQTVKTRPGARTCGVDRQTHTVYLPTAEMLPREGRGRPRMQPDSFMIVQVSRGD